MHDTKPLNPWVPMDDPVDHKVVGKSMEEVFEYIAAAARLGQCIARCFIQGVNEAEPETGKSNKKWLEEEIADVQANLQVMQEHFGLDTDFIEVRAALKARRQRKWHGLTPAPTVGSARVPGEKIQPESCRWSGNSSDPERRPDDTDLIYDWGDAEWAKRNTMTVLQMLGTLSPEEIVSARSIKPAVAPYRSVFGARNGWVWNLKPLLKALDDNFC